MTSTTSSDTSTEKPAVPTPNLPIPPAICSTTPGTWAYDTMTRRIDEEILHRTYEENKDVFLPSLPITEKFNALREELRNAANTKLRYPQPDPEGDDKDVNQKRKEEVEAWNKLLKPYVEKGDTWISAPWMVAEFYVYRRLMEATGYWDATSKTYQWDPFKKQKVAGMKVSTNSAEAILQRMDALPKSPTKNNDNDHDDNTWWKPGVQLAAELALWGNKMDLSLWPVNVNDDTDEKKEEVAEPKEEEDAFAKVLASAKENLLHDDTDKLLTLCSTLMAKGGGNIDIIVDNAGFELITDLILADHLIAVGVAKTVTFQVKSHPTFVSDATQQDVMQHVAHYACLDETKLPYCNKAGQRWDKYVVSGQWRFSEGHNFWVQPWPMWEMVEPLRSDMAQRCDLAFVKGDANYRRLLGDRTWDYTLPFQEVVGCYFPCAVCALRALKAEVGCGMEKAQVERAKALDENWLVNGRFGVIHFGTGAAGVVEKK